MKRTYNHYYSKFLKWQQEDGWTILVIINQFFKTVVQILITKPAAYNLVVCKLSIIPKSDNYRHLYFEHLDENKLNNTWNIVLNFVPVYHKK